MTDAIPKLAGIYAIVNKTNGARYVGQTADMSARVRDHFRNLANGTHRTNAERRLQEAWDQYGADAFEAVVLDFIDDNRSSTEYHSRPDNLSLAEQWYINERSEYNVDKGIVRGEFDVLVNAIAWRAIAK